MLFLVSIAIPGAVGWTVSFAKRANCRRADGVIRYATSPQRKLQRDKRASPRRRNGRGHVSINEILQRGTPSPEDLKRMLLSGQLRKPSIEDLEGRLVGKFGQVSMSGDHYEADDDGFEPAVIDAFANDMQKNDGSAGAGEDGEGGSASGFKLRPPAAQPLDGDDSDDADDMTEELTLAQLSVKSAESTSRTRARKKASRVKLDAPPQLSLESVRQATLKARSETEPGVTADDGHGLFSSDVYDYLAAGISDPQQREALESLGFARPTAIQAGALPRLLRGADTVLEAPTGSGKTLAFALTALARVTTRAQAGSDVNHVQALIIAPGWV